MQKTGVFKRLKTRMHAHAAALRHGRPSRKLRVVFVVGQDSAVGTIAYLAAILRAAGEKVGVVTQQYVEIAEEHVQGSDQADLNSDAYRLQGLLAHMRKAHCSYALIEIPPELPEHQFAGVEPSMVIVRRCGDDHAGQITVQARLAMLGNVLARKPEFVVFNRDDPCSTELAHLSGQEGVISFGTHQKAECKITNVALHPKGSAIDLLVDHQTEIHLVTTLTGKQAIYNATAAAAGAYVLHAPIKAIEEGTARLEPLPGQLEFIPIQRPYHIVLDSAFTPSGLAETLEALKHFTKNRLIVLLSAPLGVQAAWRARLGEIAAATADRLVISDGEYSSEHSPQQVREQILQGVAAAGGDAKAEEVPERRAAIEKAVSIARRGDIVLLAGVTQRPYRQLGTERLPWSDRKVLEELFES